MGTKRTLQYLYEKKSRGEKMPRTTLYDYPLAVLAEAAGIDIINVGDTLAEIALGYNNTLAADMDIMVEHAKAVRRGAPTAFIMGDMPFLSYQVSIPEAIKNAGRYLREADMDAVKLEGGTEQAPVIRALTSAGIPVIAHTGLTPQSIKAIGSYGAQGRDAVSASELVREVAELEKAGAVAVLLETVPVEVARIIYERTTVPLLGTGVGPYNDSPMINAYDLLGFYDRIPRFAKRYARLKEEIVKAFSAFVEDVRTGRYPGEEHQYSMSREEYTQLVKLLELEQEEK